MHDMNKIQNERQQPSNGGNIISHSRKWQELELQIWNVTSGALQHLPRPRSSHISLACVAASPLTASPLPSFSRIIPGSSSQDSIFTTGGAAGVGGAEGRGTMEVR